MHANAKYHKRTTTSQPSEPSEHVQRFSRQLSRTAVMLEHDVQLWNTPITMPDTFTLHEKSTYQNDNIGEISKTENIEERAEEIFEENFEELGTEIPVNLDNIDLDPEDLQGASLDDALDAIEGKNLPECVAKWPNDAYRDFMRLIQSGRISITEINQKWQRPSQSNNFTSLDFKEKVVSTYSSIDITFYYCPIFRAIQALLQRPEVANNFVYKGILKKKRDDGSEIRVFGEPYEGDWWLETEKILPLLNHLLSIILYLNRTTFDGLGKTSGHPVFLTLRNVPNWV
ncbi:hypothetical protein GLOIN_2v1763780 [Rhizophagus irregularis DAOM 181602=DAOM 197198]|nr:hypothetical protein GLOIN_2v1763780 [Rhizophagus irregularis DAOM 181602=DAOM 197198]